MTELPVISADSHIQEPPELWLNAKCRHRAPRTETRDGKTYVITDDKKPRRIDLADGRVNEEDQDRDFRGDPIALRCLDLIGAETLFLGSDYPHDEGTFPHCQDVITRTFAGVGEVDKHKIVYDNARRLYGFAP